LLASEDVEVPEHKGQLSLMAYSIGGDELPAIFCGPLSLRYSHSPFLQAGDVLSTPMRVRHNGNKMSEPLDIGKGDKPL